MPVNTVRFVSWGVGLVLAGSAFGVGWATQPVEVPLWGLFVVTFVPTSDLIDAIREVLDAAVAKAAGEKPGGD
jgi:ABC-type multidrug transport system permease subunit